MAGTSEKIVYTGLLKYEESPVFWRISERL